MPLPKIRISTWRKNDIDNNYLYLSDEEVAKRVYRNYKRKDWLNPSFIRSQAKIGKILKDENQNPILNVYAGDVSEEKWTEEFLLGKHEWSERPIKDVGRAVTKVVHGFGSAIGGIGSFEKGSPFSRALMKTQGEEEFLKSIGAKERALSLIDPKEKAAREEQYQYILSNWLGLGKYFGLPSTEDKPINALQAVELDLAKEIKEKQLKDPKAIENLKRDMIQERFGHVSDKMLRKWALTEVEKQDLKEVRDITAGGVSFRQPVMRPGGMGVEGFKKRPILGTLAFLGGDLGPFIYGMSKATKGIEAGATAVLATKAKPVQMINKMLEKLPTWKYWDKSWVLAKTTLDKATGKRIPINRKINLRNVATEVPKITIAAEISAQVVFDPYEQRLSRIIAEQVYNNDKEAAGFYASLWNPDDSELEARAKMALENVILLPAGYAVAKTAFGVFGRVLRGPKDKLAMFMERLGNDVEAVHIEKQAKTSNIDLEDIATIKHQMQFSPHSWLRKPYNHLILRTLSKSRFLTNDMFK